jgi:hypothetical protein
MYKEKYLKYKKKYLDLKRLQKGGNGKCINNCGRLAYLHYKKCCLACNDQNGPHTQDCNARQHMTMSVELLPINGINKSSGLYKNNLFNILTDIRNQILQKYKDIAPTRMVQNSPFHIELVDDANIGDQEKINRYNYVQQVKIDMCSRLNWYCLGKAFVLKVCNYKGKDLHVTICYFNDGCNDKLADCQSIVETVIQKKLH